ncbi:MAG: 4-(cytidine 5'-diphospho)-2-C-methyl-D-erythritol kinase [Oscillospiraceae bacterium]|nr:4-(cytidine 5'-diphospho)-2-C-methyl-D-erythritol kinase [Oscillospiraceae bacterium]
MCGEVRRMKVKAGAKLNLTLDVIGRREDGYHDLRMVMQTVELADTLRLERGQGQGIRVKSNIGFLPADEHNLAAAAALAFQRETGIEVTPLDIALDKVIPICAGLGGGSSDAAAVLRALNELYNAGLSTQQLARVGEQVGSDVPYCVMGGTALAEGRGEVLTPLPPLPRCRVVLCKPDFSVSTPALFARIDSVRLRCRPDTKGVLAALEQGDLEGVARRLYNVFEDALPQRCAAKVEQVKQILIQSGALGAVMSGTGSSVYGLFRDETCAQDAYEQLKQLYPETFLTYTV